MPDPVRFYAVTVSNHTPPGTRREDRDPWVWSEPFAEIRDARRAAKVAVDEGLASLGFVVREDGGVRRVVHTEPKSARRIVEHFQDLLAALAAWEKE